MDALEANERKDVIFTPPSNDSNRVLVMVSDLLTVCGHRCKLIEYMDKSGMEDMEKSGNKLLTDGLELLQKRRNDLLNGKW